jgi:hypothetical protein
MNLRGRLPTGDWSPAEIEAAEAHGDQVIDILQYALCEVGVLDVEDLNLQQRTAVETLALLDRAAKHAFDTLGISVPELNAAAVAVFQQVYARINGADN